MMNPFSVLWRAALIGTADIVPGVSGGTMALITGLYERLIQLITTLLALPKHIYTSKTLAPLKEVDWGFALTLALGVATAFITAVHLLVPLITQQPGLVYAFFSGLIIGAAFMLILYNTTRVAHTIAGIMGFALGIGVLFIPTTTTPHTTFMLLIGFAAGFVMLLPGVSGSYLLLVTGHYALILGALRTPMQHLTLLVPFGVGVLIGISMAALSVQHVLKRARQLTLVFLAGIMLGALATPLGTIYHATNTTPGWIGVGALLILGITVAAWMQQKVALPSNRSSQN